MGEVGGPNAQSHVTVNPQPAPGRIPAAQKSFVNWEKIAGWFTNLLKKRDRKQPAPMNGDQAGTLIVPDEAGKPKKKWWSRLWAWQQKNHYGKTVLLLVGTAILATQIFNMTPWGTYNGYKVWLINRTGIHSFGWVIFFLCLGLVSFFILFYFPLSGRKVDESKEDKEKEGESKRQPLHLSERITWVAFALSIFMLILLLNFLNQCKVPYIVIKTEWIGSELEPIDTGKPLLFIQNQWRTVSASFISSTEANLLCTWDTDLKLNDEIIISDEKSCSPKVKLLKPVQASTLILKASSDICIDRTRSLSLTLKTH